MASGIVPPALNANPSGIPNTRTSLCQDCCVASNLWESRIRLAFLTFAIVCGAIAAYTTRHFVNGDALVYFDMADAVEKHQWADLINLHYSPGYAVLLGLAEAVLNVGSLNELFLAKALNFLCYVLSLLALEVLLQQLKTDGEFAPNTRLQHIDWLYFRAAAYGLFLVCALVYIRIQVVSPDMLEFCFTLIVVAVLVWIKKSSGSFAQFVVLGLVAGIGYICKTPFFVMSFVFFVLAACYATSISRAVPRVLVAAIVFLTISSAVCVPISNRLGRLSFGESGSFNYTYFVSGSGKPVHVPEKVWHSPDVDVYSGGSLAATYPRGFDLAYWNEGVKPSFDLKAQIPVLVKNMLAVLDLNPWLHVLFLLWICLQVRMGASFAVTFHRPALSVLFGAIAVAGTGLFCLVLVEARYIAPHVFLGLVAVLLWPRHSPDRFRARRTAHAGVVLITTFLIGTTVVSIWDQSSRSLYDQGTKQSHRSVFLENRAVKEFLNSRGVSRGDLAGILGSPSIGMYWARLSGLKATAAISDQQAFLAASSQARAGAVNALSERRFKVIFGTGEPIGELKEEGWCPVPRTKNSYVLFLQ